MKKVLVFSESSAAAEKIGELLRAEDGYDLRAVPDLRAARAADADALLLVLASDPAACAKDVRTLALETTMGLAAVVREPLRAAAEEAFRGLGVFVLPSLGGKTLCLAVDMAVKSGERLRVLGSENVRLKESIGDLKLIDRAKCALIQYLNMTEESAHRFIEKQAMDRRVSKREVALGILKTYES